MPETYQVDLYHIGEDGKPVVEHRHEFVSDSEQMADSFAREWVATTKAVVTKATFARLRRSGGEQKTWPLAGYL